MQRSDLPDGFVVGSATASYQIEGATHEDGRGESIWDAFARVPGAIADGSTGDVADDHYHRWPEDVALMSDLGLDAYRFSIAWPRIQADGTGPANRAGLDFYRRLAESLRERGITPWATLYHWDLPQALENRGGWLDRDTAMRFADYAALVAEELGDVVTDWITLNEPWCSAFLGYASGHHAPGRTLGSRSAHAAHHLLLGHGHALEALRATVPSANVGTTLNLYSVQPAGDSEADADAARRIDGLSNRFFLDPVLKGAYPADVLEDLGETQWFAENATDDDLKRISAPIDFLGINYYSRHTVASGSNPATGGPASAYPGSEHVRFVKTGAPVTQMGWEIHPDGMVDVLRQANALAPGLPLYITENGAAYPDRVGADGEIDDPQRAEYLEAHFEAARDAVAEGLPLQGYFIWSLIDNWEWAWGYSRRFGIVHVDYTTQKRTPKRSARWVADFLRDAVPASR
ncbi:GH1 family beta-glucosidase [Leifsonia sp. 1010]|uniref:GH1 family beta-glucosidase n=1 Tax=Leifsonia sp. 1010 TaxID=2817769 RepID=UPI002862F27C|nr:GH1 family beta-glucosidase [Leifsonia sp. 1010]MDR6611790.1 beta-glucosidase [Leifsonia sp. 1010]